MSYEADARRELIQRLRNVYASPANAYSGRGGRCPKGKKKYAPPSAYTCIDKEGYADLRKAEREQAKLQSQMQKELARLQRMAGRKAKAKKPRKKRAKKAQAPKGESKGTFAEYQQFRRRYPGTPKEQGKLWRNFKAFRKVGQPLAQAMNQWDRAITQVGSGYNPNYGGPGDIYAMDGGVMLDSMYGEGRSGGVLMDQFYGY